MTNIIIILTNLAKNQQNDKKKAVKSPTQIEQTLLFTKAISKRCHGIHLN